MPNTARKFLLGLVFLASGATVAAAQGNGGALVFNSSKEPLECSFEIEGIPPLFTEENIHAVLTPSGNLTFTCHFDIPQGFEPSRPILTGGSSCTVFLPTGEIFNTNTGKFTATPGGQATFQCKVKARDLP
jgi:hypothetical protein